MSEKNSGIAAFPQMCAMTLRDYFAAKAMQGFCANPNFDDSADNFAKASYQVADSMLKARAA